MNIRGIEVDFDFLDGNDVERFENKTIEFLKKIEEEEKKEYTLSESIKAQCKIVEDFIDDVFGKGVSNKIFSKHCNLREHLEIYEEVANTIIGDRKDLETKFQRYQPNRENRRNNQFKKGKK